MSTRIAQADVGAIETAVGRIYAIAEGFGLDPFPLHFEIVPPSIMYEFGAYGIPGRFSHWTHGRAYHQMKTMYDYGLSKIYELVINTNPCYAFLLDTNGFVQNKMIIAHVLAHSVSVNADRLRRYEFEHGKEAVEKMLDSVLAIQEHVEADATTYKRRPLYND